MCVLSFDFRLFGNATRNFASCFHCAIRVYSFHYFGLCINSITLKCVLWIYVCWILWPSEVLIKYRWGLIYVRIDFNVCVCSKVRDQIKGSLLTTFINQRYILIRFVVRTSTGQSTFKGHWVAKNNNKMMKNIWRHCGIASKRSRLHGLIIYCNCQQPTRTHINSTVSDQT